MAGGAGKRSKHPRARTGTDTLQAHTRPDETLEAADEGAEAVGRSIELVFGDGEEGEGGSGSGTRTALAGSAENGRQDVGEQQRVGRPAPHQAAEDSIAHPCQRRLQHAAAQLTRGSIAGKLQRG